MRDARCRTFGIDNVPITAIVTCSMGPGSSNQRKRATIRDVADLAGVSRATVTRALEVYQDSSIKPETRARVLDAASRLNYRPSPSARSLKSRRPMAACIPFVRQGSSRTGTGQISLSLGDIMSSALDVLQPVGYRLEPAFFSSDEQAAESLTSMALAGYFDAALVPYPRATMIEAYRRMAELGIIIVMRAFPIIEHPNIYHFELPGNSMRPVVEELYRQNRRRILFTRPILDDLTDWVRAMPGLSVDSVSFPYNSNSIQENVRDYLETNRRAIAWTDAIVCWDEFIGWEIFKELTRRGVRVPDEKTVSGAADFRHIFKPLPVQLLNYAPGAMDVGFLGRKLLKVLQDRNMLSKSFEIPPILRRPECAIHVLPAQDFKKLADAELRRESLLAEVERFIVSEEELPGN